MYEVIGFRRSEGKSKSTGKDYAGYMVFFSFDQKGVEGKACDQAFIADSLGYDPILGDRVQLFYNARGFLMEVKTSY